jgi:hypothetical protein
MLRPRLCSRVRGIAQFNVLQMQVDADEPFIDQF